MAVDTYALTTLAKLQNHLGVTDSADEVVLEACIDRASSRIETFMDRKVLSRSYSDWVFPSDGRLVLRHWPVASVQRISWGGQLVLSVSSSISTDVRASVSVSESAVVLKRWDSAGTAATTTLDFATYPTTTDMDTAIDAATGWSSTLSRNVLSSELVPMSGVDVMTQSAYIVWPDVNGSPAWIDADAGIVGMPSPPAGSSVGDSRPVLVDYTAGYSTVPYDVEEACIEIASSIYRQRRYDTGQTLGDFRVVDDPVDVQRVLDGLLSGWKAVR